MSAFERLLVPGCTELPVCRCGEEMEITSFDEFPAGSDAVIRITPAPHAATRCGLLFGLRIWRPERSCLRGDQRMALTDFNAIDFSDDVRRCAVGSET
jgi:hypothetical protein